LTIYRVTLDGSTHDLRRLAQWLREKDEIRTTAKIAVVPVQPAPGTMGATEVIELVVNIGFSSANLALAIAAWRRSRAQAPVVRIEVGERTVVIDVTDPAEVTRAIKSATADE
jgi:Xaa-Pro aminopeptidase